MSQEKLSLKGSMFPITVMDLLDADFSALRTHLSAAVHANPSFFADAPLIIDCGQVDEMSIDFSLLKSIVSDAGMFLVGLSGIEAEQIPEAHARGLPIFKQIGSKRSRSHHPVESALETPVSSPETDICQSQDDQHNSISEENCDIDFRPAPESERETTHTPDQAVAATNSYTPPMIVNGIVRSGQRLYAEGRDMILFGNVSPGAEIIADGHIHIYGKLRGRSLAGAQGNTDAFICATNIQAELISIAGYYKVLEDDRAYASMGAMMVTLDDTSLKFTTIDQI